MPQVTVLLPVLNGMPYLPEALASLDAQTFRDFEVVLWDNGSKDGTLDEARSWIPERLPGRVVTDQPLPLHLCLARMVEEASTEFCARMDADDICHPDRLATQVHVLKMNTEIAALGSQADDIDERGVSLDTASRFPADFPDILSAMLVQNALLHPTVVFRREAVLMAGNYAAEKPCEDYDLWLRVSALGKLENIDRPLLSYRQHPASIIASARVANELEQPNLACIERHSGPIFHLRPDVYRRLREKKHPFAAAPLLGAASAIARRCGVSLFRVLRSPSFLWSARCLTGPRDLASKAAYRLMETAGKPTSSVSK